VATTWQYRTREVAFMRFLLWVAVNALALAAATALLDGIRLTGATTEDKVVTLVVVAIIFGLVNAVVRPVVKLISLPFIILTLGLLVLVINALMLMLTGWLSGQLTLGFRVDGFWTAVLGGIVIMIATWVLEAVFPDRD
jgi:putative membrane protein